MRISSGAHKWVVLILLTGAGVYLVFSRLGTHDSAAWTSDFSAALARASADRRRVLVAVTSDSCPACRRMELVLDRPEVVAAVRRFVPVRISPTAQPDLVRRFVVDSYPTFLVTDSTGRIIARTTGFQPMDAFLGFLERAGSLPNEPVDNRPVAQPLSPANGSAISKNLVAPQSSSTPWSARGKKYMVAADSAYASRAGQEMLDAGGNAFDAAAAVSFALAVCRPESTGLGGGGFMLARTADGNVVILDFRETAPSAAAADLYTTGETAKDEKAGRNGLLAVAVPGLVKGRCDMLRRWGKLPLTRVLAPAIRLAEEGFAVDDSYVKASGVALKEYVDNPTLRERCSFVYRTFLNNGALFEPGYLLKQPELARCLRRLADEGPDFFYHGEFAAALADHMASGRGIVRREDLASYQVKDRAPLIGKYRDFTILTMPPPSSGGVAIIQTLNVLEHFPMATLRDDEVRPAAHLLVEAMKHAFADRSRYLGDADFVDVPVRFLTSPAYARSLAMRIQRAMPGVLPIETYGIIPLPEDAGTSHFCVVDAAGNAVVSTETINTEFGSLAAVDEWGVVLNNEMDDFQTRPGEPNAFGLIQSQRNGVQPGKRPLSSMSPTLVLKDDQPYLMLGASGGPRIISAVLNVMVNVLDFGEPLDEAMLAVRVHHQWQPDKVFFDRDPPEALVELLRVRGHVLELDERRGAIVQAIVRDDDAWLGASDPRKGGRPAGQ